jgi:hypothetical protein
MAHFVSRVLPFFYLSDYGVGRGASLLLSSGRINVFKSLRTRKVEKVESFLSEQQIVERAWAGTDMKVVEEQ